MKYTTFTLFLCIFYANAGFAGSERYQTCASLVNTAPKQALQQSRAWAKGESSPSASHCMAMAQFALKDYPSAAKNLEKLLPTVKGNQFVYAHIVSQLARVYDVLDAPEKAGLVLNDAVFHLMQLDDERALSHILNARYKHFENQKQYLKAINDLDHVINIAPTAELYIARAGILLKLKKAMSARWDLEAALKLDPTNRKATMMLQSL